MGWPFLGDGQGWETAGRLPASTSMVQVPGSASFGFKGSWTEIIAAHTGFPTSGFFLHVVGFSPASSGSGSATCLLDIAIGASGSEQIILADMAFSLFWDTSANMGAGPAFCIFFPLSIPAGTRIAARCSTSAVDGVAAVGPQVSLSLVAGDWETSEAANDSETIGVNAGIITTLGTSGVTAHTKSSWTALTTSTLYPASMAYIFVKGDGSPPGAQARVLVDIGIGGAGSEQVIIADLPFLMGTASGIDAPSVIGPIPVQIIDNTRVAIRAQSSQLSTGLACTIVLLHG